MSISLDGFFEGPNHELEWQLVDDELHQHFNDVLRHVGGFLDGRRTHELMAGYWPTADLDPNNSGPVREFASIWRDTPKTVYSRTMDANTTQWNTRVVREVVPEEVQALKAQPGGDLAIGGAEVAAEFLRNDLIDELRIYVHPVVLGEGKPLFPRNHRARFALLETWVFRSGVVLLRYARREA